MNQISFALPLAAVLLNVIGSHVDVVRGDEHCLNKMKRDYLEVCSGINTQDSLRARRDVREQQAEEQLGTLEAENAQGEAEQVPVEKRQIGPISAIVDRVLDSGEYYAQPYGYPYQYGYHNHYGYPNRYPYGLPGRPFPGALRPGYPGVFNSYVAARDEDQSPHLTDEELRELYNWMVPRMLRQTERSRDELANMISASANKCCAGRKLVERCYIDTTILPCA